MKKLLFTFATLFAALTAGAAIVPTLEFSSSEISVVPGGDAVQVQILLTEDGTAGAMKSNQLQWGMFNAAHEIMETSPAVTLVQTDIADYEEDEEADPDFRYLVPGNVAQKRKFDGCIDNYVRGYYRILCVRMDGKDILTATSAATYAASDPTVWTITIKADANWDEEFATLELASTPEYACMWQDANGASYMNFEEDAPMVLKIKNANYVPPVVTKDLAGEVNVTVDENGNITATYTPAEGEPAEGYTCVCDPAKMEDYGTVDVTVTVTPEAEGYNPTDFEATATWTKPAPKELTGTLTISDHVNGHFTVTYSGDEDVEITCTITKQGAKESTEGYDLPGYGIYEVYAKATATDAAYEGDFVDATKVLTWEMPKLQGTVEVTVDDNGHVTASYVAAEGEENLNPTVTVTPENLTQYGEDIPVTVTVTVDGYEPLVVNTTVDYLEPVTPPAGKTNSPSVNKYNDIVYDGPNQCHNEYHISYTNAESDPDATIYYAVGVGTYDEATDTWTFEYQTDENGDTIFMEYTDELIYTTVGTYQITAYAQTPGKEKSDYVIDRFTVASTTSIEEMFADKTVAGVRYFNLAGQEMQEANGICISVYTFTDGTQVAVKVMQ